MAPINVFSSFIKFCRFLDETLAPLSKVSKHEGDPHHQSGQQQQQQQQQHHLDLDSFRRRLKKFKPLTWSSLNPVTPLDCALSGFSLISQDLVKCSSCEVVVYGKIPVSSDPQVFNKSAQRLRDKLSHSHSKFCPWARLKAPETHADLEAFPFDEEKMARKSLEFGSKCLPVFTDRTRSKLMQDEGGIKSLALKLQNGNSNYSAIETQSAVLLSACGWSIQGSAVVPLITCGICRRECGSWMYRSLDDPEPVQGQVQELFPVEEEAEAAMGAIVKDTLDEIVNEEVQRIVDEATADEQDGENQAEAQQEHQQGDELFDESRCNNQSEVQHEKADRLMLEKEDADLLPQHEEANEKEAFEALYYKEENEQVAIQAEEESLQNGHGDAGGEQELVVQEQPSFQQQQQPFVQSEEIRNDEEHDVAEEEEEEDAADEDEKSLSGDGDDEVDANAETEVEEEEEQNHRGDDDEVEDVDDEEEDEVDGDYNSDDDDDDEIISEDEDDVASEPQQKRFMGPASKHPKPQTSRADVVDDDDDDDCVVVLSSDDDDIPQLDGTYDLDLDSNPHPLKPYFHPLENHLPWCPWLKPLRHDPDGDPGYLRVIKRINGTNSPQINSPKSPDGEKSLREVRQLLNP